jgi:hypothetical protein
LLELACCHAALSVSNLSAPHDDDDPAAAEASWLRIKGLLAEARPVATTLYIEFLTTAMV